MHDHSVRIVIADDHPVFRHGLRKLLDGEPGMEVVGEAEHGVDAVHLARQLRPNVLLLDVAMPRLQGLEVVTEIAREWSAGHPWPPTHIIILTAAISEGELLKAFELGVRGVVLKDAATRVLVDSIRTVADGGYWVGPEGVGSLVEAVRRLAGTAPSQERPYGLTRRELDIVTAIAAGCSNKEIAQQFAISLQTVKHHLTSVFDKTGVSTRLELALLALRHHLVDE
jgi:DNA-binding NarL/FixJ family response regulator